MAGYKAPSTDSEFYLDTSNFDEVIRKCNTLADTMANLKNNMDSQEQELLSSWAGDGRNTFEKKYRILSQQFGDLEDDLRDTSERLLKDEESYIQADTDAAKALDGVTRRW